MNNPSFTPNTTWNKPCPSPPPSKRTGGSFSLGRKFSLIAWKFYSYKIGCHYFWPQQIGLHKNTLPTELKIKAHGCELTQTSVGFLFWSTRYPEGLYCHGFLILARFSQVSWPSLARKGFGFSTPSSVGWSYPPVVDFWDLLE